RAEWLRAGQYFEGRRRQVGGWFGHVFRVHLDVDRKQVERDQRLGKPSCRLSKYRYRRQRRYDQPRYWQDTTVNHELTRWLIPVGARHGRDRFIQPSYLLVLIHRTLVSCP